MRVSRGLLAICEGKSLKTFKVKEFSKEIEFKTWKIFYRIKIKNNISNKGREREKYIHVCMDSECAMWLGEIKQSECSVRVGI